jgi:hypothetical protein
VAPREDISYNIDGVWIFEGVVGSDGIGCGFLSSENRFLYNIAQKSQLLLCTEDNRLTIHGREPTQAKTSSSKETTWFF